MPDFEGGAKIWLECGGKRMDEYDVRPETKVGKRGPKMITTCYVQVVPDAPFKVVSSYDSSGKALDGCSLKACSEGYHTSQTTAMPYTFRPLELSEDGDEAKKNGMGDVKVSLKPFRITRYHLPSAASWRVSQAPPPTTSHPDSKAALLGYAVGLGAVTQATTRNGATYSIEHAPGLPRLVAVFRYRTRDQLIAQGLVADDSAPVVSGQAPISSNVTNTTSSGLAPSTTHQASTLTPVKPEEDEGVQSARKRLRDLQNEIDALRANLAGGRDGEGVEEVKPKRFRIDATGEVPAKSPVKLSVDLTGDDDDDDDE